MAGERGSRAWSADPTAPRYNVSGGGGGELKALGREIKTNTEMRGANGGGEMERRKEGGDPERQRELGRWERWTGEVRSRGDGERWGDRWEGDEDRDRDRWG